ncbi:hypothetical protein BGY98DRAFT_1004960 [Russula aff. rugulosa BPL654]|nr:hypothetical protein BGY98DRAFT_1004960 [Russula aff. rugulosa BPL654]
MCVSPSQRTKSSHGAKSRHEACSACHPVPQPEYSALLPLNNHPLMLTETFSCLNSNWQS